ncbi:ankyrin repeat-containing protein BDA1 [Capsicum chacoense]|uniref:PGG domain-containing protein n=1 Tax=Capsicum annuum TaxID=4072 RepID=A0A1U8H734_CAPAN|nr:ankyrin repeat-containing protein BDA1 [Capsicum annuum]KAF3644194.1 putative protein FAF-like, chloroplastic-like [Capsicum annuum]PHT80007.1 hypothetical protein T459_18059 [Capsicum annuum]
MAEELKRAEELKQAEELMERAARAGDIDAFYKVLEREPLILKEIEEKEFVETPLHAAASAGRTNFAIEMLSLRPSFGRKLDPRGYTPLDLALREGHRDTVKQLIRFDPKLIQVRSRERKTPLHYVTEINDDDLLSEFLIACPTAIKEVNIQGETAVHLAVRNGRIQAFKVLIGWIHRTDNREILDWKDNSGSTVLHIAAQTGQVEVVKYLTKERVDLDVRNPENKTALDIAADGIADDPQNHSALSADSNKAYLQVQKILHRVGAMYSSELPKSITMVDVLTVPYKNGRIQKKAKRAVDSRKGLTEDMRNAYLVVTVLIVTASFQGVLSPPGGGWQSDEKDNNNNKNNTALVLPPPPSITTMKYSESSIQKANAPAPPSNLKNFLEGAISKESLFYPFLIVNSVTFAFSAALTYMLLPFHGHDTVLLFVSLMFLMGAYSMSVTLIAPPNSHWIITTGCTYAALLIFHGVFGYTRLTPEVAATKWIPIASVRKFTRRLFATDLFHYRLEKRVRLGKYMT